MDKHHNRPGINLFIFSSIVIFLLLYTTYSLDNYHDYTLKADNNPPISTNNAAPESVSYEGEDTNTAGRTLAKSPVKESKTGDINKKQNAENDGNGGEGTDLPGGTHEEQSMGNDKNGVDNVGSNIKDGSIKEIEVAEETQSEEIETTAEKLKQEEPKPKKMQTMKMASREVTASGSKLQRNINLDRTLNTYVLDVIKTYETGNYPYLLNNDYQNYNGVTENLYYNGELLLKANPNGNRACHCTGITFEVFFKAMQNRNRDLGIDINNFNGMDTKALYDFALTWYVAKGPKDKNNLALAMEKDGVGKRIYNMEELRAGDFMDFSRENGTGHSAVFINWIRAGDKIIGFRYWSSQGSTNGINYNEEYFNVRGNNGNKYGNVMIDSLYMGKISPVSEYKSFR